MSDTKPEEEMMLLATFGLSDVEVSFPDDSTAVLTCHFKEGTRDSGRQDTFVWARRGEQWHCVMHSQKPAATMH